MGVFWGVVGCRVGVESGKVVGRMEEMKDDELGD